MLSIVRLRPVWGLWVLALAAGCTSPPIPMAPTPVDPSMDCTVETVETQVTYHNLTLTKQNVKDYLFHFANLTRLELSLHLEAEGTVTYGNETGDAMDWTLHDPNGDEAWRWARNAGAGFPNPTGGGSRAIVEDRWVGEDLGRVTGTWTLHLDGRGNAEVTFRLVGTSTPCQMDEFTETVVEG